MTDARQLTAAGAAGALAVLIPAAALDLLNVSGLIAAACAAVWVGTGAACAYYADAGRLAWPVWLAAWPLLGPVYVSALGARTLERRHYHERTRRRLKAQYLRHVRNARTDYFEPLPDGPRVLFDHHQPTSHHWEGLPVPPAPGRRDPSLYYREPDAPPPSPRFTWPSEANRAASEILRNPEPPEAATPDARWWLRP